MTRIIHNFSSKKRIASLPITDILIWYVGLKQLKSVGHTIKLYCEEKDLPFLERWGLLRFYDEIDTSFLPSSELIKRVDGRNFWSIRKIECIGHEFETSDEPFIYSDTDVVMNVELRPTGDLMVWSPENDSPIYVDWAVFSTPKGYSMPDFVKEADQAFNCGILYFANEDIFRFYRTQYISFVYDNPCIMDSPFSAETQKNMWACNAEQRILYAVARYLSLDVCCIMPRQEKGVCRLGTHYYYLREGWRQLNAGILKGEHKGQWTKMLNDAILELMGVLDETGLTIFLGVDWLRKLYFDHIPIDAYK